MAAAVSGLSPVIITVRMPIARSWAKRSLMPPFTTSFRKMTPSGTRPSATTSGVPPWRAMSSTAVVTAVGKPPPWASTQARTLAAAPLRMERAGWSAVAVRSTPLIRVCAVNGTKVACVAASSRPRRLNFSLASTTMLRPSGVSSASEASWAASASCSRVMPGAGTKSAAWRLPSVMVPVLSSRSTSMSPAASTARPEVARTLRCSSRSMPAMPMALSSPPMVVGIRQTSRAIRVVSEKATPEYAPNGFSAATTSTKMNVSAESRMVSAISLGVFWRVAPSTRLIMWSRKPSPGLAVMRISRVSDSTAVPPVTALRSPPASRMTGADSPVMADSSTDAAPSMTSPSPGMRSPAWTNTTSPLASRVASMDSREPSRRLRRAMSCLREARRARACALPRPSATASAKLAKTTVKSSQRATWST